MEHEAEIYGRPARTWFVSEREKKASALAAKLASEEGQAANADYAEVRGVKRA